MFDFFEQPWTLLGVAILVLLGLLTYRSVTDKRRAWHFLIPILIAGAGFGLDALVTTDRESVRAVVAETIQAAENEDCAAIGRLLTSDYRDGYHRSKESFLDHCRRELNGPTVVEAKKLSDKVEVSGRTAKVRMTVKVRFEDSSRVAREYKRSCAIVVEMVLQKQPSGRWLISRADLKSVDDTFPISWGGA